MYNSSIKAGIRFLILIIILTSTLLYSQDIRKDKKILSVSEFLYSGQIPVQLPVYHHQPGVDGQAFTFTQLMNVEPVSIYSISPQKDHPVIPGQTDLIWNTVRVSDSKLVLPAGRPDIAEMAYLAVYLQADEWLNATVHISTPGLCNLYLDGNLIYSKTTSGSKNSETTDFSQPVTLETGKHLLIMKLMKQPELKENMWVQTEIETDWKNTIKATTLPRQSITLEHIIHSNVPYDVSISPDGQMAAVAVSNSIISPDDKESWLELWDIKTGKKRLTFRGGFRFTNLSWKPSGHIISYTTSDQNKSSLWQMDVKNGISECLLQDMENFGGYTWSPDGSFLIYSLSEKPEPETSGVHRLDGMADRLPGYKRRSYLYRFNVITRMTTRLTAGTLSTYLQDISSDGQHILFSTTHPDYTTRDYSVTGLYMMNLYTFAIDSIWSGQWFSSAQWSPDGKQLLITGGPSMFGGIGINVPVDRIPNDYDTQAYLYTLSSGKIDPITKNFKPQIRTAFWNKYNKYIYFVVTDKSHRNVYRYHIQKQEYLKIKTGVEVLDVIDFAIDQPVAVCYGSGARMPARANIIDLKKNECRELTFPAAEQFAQVTIGDVKRWTFKNKQGDEIEGRVHYPPAFDPQKSYPAIVYYYAGTSPVTRDFGGRYPKNYWAANGYVVYVLQPSGATGFGQEFSSRHVNDWGLTTVNEIIQGTQEFLKAHPFVDKNRVGCIGASYGGFMTMLLTTKTDIFKAAVSHAGISSLASYWGEGYWGYSYSGVATANSFPWNRKTFYVEQSALYNADKINTPLLLLHGMADTNVPPGESIQLYTALKLLGKDVEFVQIENQNHWILEYGKRSKWAKTIVAYFDKYLKDQPGWWNAMYE